MASEPPSFEVYCQTCDVTFPVGTRSCIHCGGAISRSGHRFVRQSAFESGFGSAGSAEFESEWGDATEFQALPEESGDDEFVPLDAQLAAFDEVGQATEEPATGRSILRSLGSLVWIVLLVAYSLYNSCGD